MADYDYPVFVMAHVVCPHPPFIFGPEVQTKSPSGTQLATPNLNTSEKVKRYKSRYSDQVAYLNQLILKMVDDILSRPGKKPIIILQADHGDRYVIESDHWPNQEDPRDPFAILNAIYYPDGDYSHFYDSVSSVNTFRFLFNKYFSTNYDILPDKYYFDNFSDRYDFTDLAGFQKRHQQIKFNSKKLH